jgi:bis(5'-adenosyl)-triphosphatase
MLERAYSASALNVAIQDGRDAGQSVMHVHAHVIPRKARDFKDVDDVYKELEGEGGDVGGQLERREGEKRRGDGYEAFVPPDTEGREARSEEEMQKEAEWLAKEMERVGEESG